LQIENCKLLGRFPSNLQFTIYNLQFAILLVKKGSVRDSACDVGTNTFLNGADVSKYFAAVWQCRYFWLSLVRMDLRTRYRRSVLGMGWSLLHPLAMTGILCVVFYSMFHRQITEYAPYLLAGLATWNYLITATLQGCQCFFLGESYIRQYPAPLAVYPLRTALGGTIHFLVALCVVLALTWCFKGFANPWCLITLAPTLVLLFVLSWSVAVIAGFANVYFQDTQHLCEVLFQILFYATPIMYRPEDLGGRLVWLMRYNPLVAFLRLVRDPILDGRLPSPTTCAVAGCSVAVAVLLAGGMLARLQKRLIFHL
jgi:ABC-type polysaccharide/polyol phosphate export permease